jgi:predicted nucleic acid-binding protein
LIALWNKNDQWHNVASAAFQLLKPTPTRFVTTSLVLIECANAAARRSCRAEVVRLREDLQIAGDLIDPMPAEIEAAWAEYAHGTIGSASVVDLVSMAVMQRLGIREVLTNDRHFAVAGFDALF